jgi:hypothetical protein
LETNLIGRFPSRSWIVWFKNPQARIDAATKPIAASLQPMRVAYATLKNLPGLSQIGRTEHGSTTLGER